jgi:hypothetical protein
MRLAATAFFLAALPSLVSAQRPALSATEIRDISYARVEGLYRGKSNRLGVCRIRFRAPKTLPILRLNRHARTFLAEVQSARREKSKP